MSVDLKLINPKLLESVNIQRCKFPDCKAACCVFGAWIDIFHQKEILQNSNLIAPHMRPGFSDPDCWFNDLVEDDKHTLSGKVAHTTVIDDPHHYGGTTCVFMREDHKCTLQVASEINGFHHWRFKPFYCILHPLDLDDQGRITIGNIDDMVNEPASCVRKSDKKNSLLAIFSEELNYLLGERY